jgi:hypothetical protein
MSIKLNKIPIGEAIHICAQKKHIDKLVGDACDSCPFAELTADDMYGCPVGHMTSNVNWNSNPLIHYNRKGYAKQPATNS